MQRWQSRLVNYTKTKHSTSSNTAAAEAAVVVLTATELAD